MEETRSFHWAMKLEMHGLSESWPRGVRSSWIEIEHPAYAKSLVLPVEHLADMSKNYTQAGKCWVLRDIYLKPANTK